MYALLAAVVLASSAGIEKVVSPQNLFDSPLLVTIAAERGT